MPISTDTFNLPTELLPDWSVTQENQQAKITTALGVDQLFLEGFTAHETLSEPFTIVCDVLGPHKAVAMSSQIGTGVSIEVTSAEHPAEVSRSFHAILAEATMVEEVELGIRYALVLRPWFWVLSLGSDCRIFQNMSARDIIKDVFSRAGVASADYSFEAVTSRGAQVRNYCVQYNESDFAFVSRLLEEEGISYHFQHSANRHVMVMGDQNGAFPKYGGGVVPIVRSGSDTDETLGVTSEHRRIRPVLTEYRHRDSHPFKWKNDFEASASGADYGMRLSPAPKAFHNPGGFAWLTDEPTTLGDAYAKLRLEADEAEVSLLSYQGGVFGVGAGQTVTLKKGGKTLDVVLTSTTHRLFGQWPHAHSEEPPSAAMVSFDCVPADRVWRPQLRTPRPTARGPHVAIVTGAQGEEIDPDPKGRVKVQFLWDRTGKFDDKSSCWLRVSSSWAGPNMGEVFFPRIGHEVLVDFLEGDMDRPLIVGRLYDDKNVIPPKIKKTQSGWKTQTCYGKSTQDYDGAVDPPTDEPGFNEIAFDDKSGEEMVYLRAQRDLWIEAFRDEKYDTHRDQTDTVGRNLSMEVKTGDETRKVTKGARTTTIEKDETLTVNTGNRKTTVSQGNDTTEVSQGDISVKAAAGSITIEAMQSITLKVGANKITIDTTGVTVEGSLITSKASGIHTIKGAQVLIN